MRKVGEVEAIFRYPVKSMAGERLDKARLGWYGIEGDRRLAFRRVDERSGRSGMPWLTASKLPELLLYMPESGGVNGTQQHAVRVRTPEGRVLPIFSEELAAEIEVRCGFRVEMMQLNHGIFDEASISVIACGTVNEIARVAGVQPDVRRFRPNVLIRLERPGGFQEDTWVSRQLWFGEGRDAAAVAVTMKDLRCSMVNLDPDTASSAPEMMKTIVRANENHAGVYGTVIREGQLAIGQSVFLNTDEPG